MFDPSAVGVPWSKPGEVHQIVGEGHCRDGLIVENKAIFLGQSPEELIHQGIEVDRDERTPVFDSFCDSEGHIMASVVRQPSTATPVEFPEVLYHLSRSYNDLLGCSEIAVLHAVEAACHVERRHLCVLYRLRKMALTEIISEATECTREDSLLINRRTGYHLFQVRTPRKMLASFEPRLNF